MMSYAYSRLILIAEKDKVYDKFPIPLINRLEKHLVTPSTILLPDQQKALHTLERWIEGFTKVQGYIHMYLMQHLYGKHYFEWLFCMLLYLICILSFRFKRGDAFIGFQSQTPATVVLQASQLLGVAVHDSWHNDVSVQCQLMGFVLTIAVIAYCFCLCTAKP